MCNKLADDAIEMLRSGEVNSFCIVTSDKGFAKLAKRIREENAFVAGIGASDKELSIFKDECDAFTYFEDLPRRTTRIRPSGSSCTAGRRRSRKPSAHARGKTAGPSWLMSGTASTVSILIFIVTTVMLGCCLS